MHIRKALSLELALEPAQKIIQPDILEFFEKFSNIYSEKANPINKKMAKFIFFHLQKMNALTGEKQYLFANQLRKDLLKFYNDYTHEKEYLNEMDFLSAVYNLLIILAKKFPINSLVDAPDDLFFTITGEQLSLKNVIEYNRQRPPISSTDLKEESNQKFLRHPTTNELLHAIDTEVIIRKCIDKAINLDFLTDLHLHPYAPQGSLSKIAKPKEIYLTSEGGSITATYNLSMTMDESTAISCIELLKKNSDLKSMRELTDNFPMVNNKRHSAPKSLFGPLPKTTLSDEIDHFSIFGVMMLLIKNNEPNTLRTFADAFATKDILNLDTKYGGLAPIHAAAYYSSEEAMAVLLDPKYGININLQNITGCTAAWYATKENNPRIFRMLAEAGANLMIPDIFNKGPIHYAALENRHEIMNILLEYKVNVEQSNYGLTAAHLAASNNSCEVIQLLIKAGADFTKPDYKGRLPIHRAALNGKLEATQCLLSHHSNRFIKDNNNHSAFYYACEQKHWEVAKLFLRKVHHEKLSQEDNDLIKQHKEQLGKPNYLNLYTQSLSLSNKRMIRGNKLRSIIEIYEMHPTKKITHRFQTGADGISGIASLSDGIIAISSINKNGNIRIYDVQKDKIIKEISQDGKSIKNSTALQVYLKHYQKSTPFGIHTEQKSSSHYEKENKALFFKKTAESKSIPSSPEDRNHLLEKNIAMSVDIPIRKRCSKCIVS